jgi:hypothetical protein
LIIQHILSPPLSSNRLLFRQIAGLIPETGQNVHVLPHKKSTQALESINHAVSFDNEQRGFYRSNPIFHHSFALKSHTML